ncbi:hypothetical protein HY989_05745 [Candidatus Micrarchaeota archaeon]|nr:hypothetical protein [Candidatus Micrarchaeota archaeon]
MAKKGFIAAPLLGTLIFLICVLLIINMTRAESLAVSQIVSDSYHNKLVSTVEIYRSDLGSVFNIGLQRNIEGILSSQCWSNFVSLKTQSKANPGTTVDYHGAQVLADKNGDGTVDEKEERFFACARSSSLMGDIVCSQPTTNGNGYIYGLSTWAKTLSEETNFEGINLKVANADAFRSLLEYQPTSEVPLCRKLIPSVEIDCEKFAEETSGNGAFQCCSKFEGDRCVVAKGCEGGNQFYLSVSVQNQDVYGKFPRILAEDMAGNKLRAGAITDVDYDAPIAYPFFRYLDAAFKFNKRLSFGANMQYDATGGDIGASRGVVEGSCIGKDTGTAGCPKLAPPYQQGVDYGQVQTSEEMAKSAYLAEFVNKVLKPACEEAKNSNLEVYIGSQRTPCGDFIANPDFSILNEQTDQCADQNNYCSYIQRFDGLQILFKDNDLATQINPNEKNSFCWYSVSEYLPPN